MGKTLSFNLTSLLVVLPILLALFNISAVDHLSESDKYINPTPVSEANYQIRTIVIDPGHGGKDGGCTGATHSIEKHLALDMALQLGKTIKASYPEIKVIYTRNRDVFVPLHRRAEIANENKADLFISIHCNNILNAPHIHGSETYVMGLHRADDNLKVAKRENQSILMEDNYQSNYDGYDPNSAEGHIILSFVQNAYLEQSILFAEKVEKHIHHKTGRKSRGVKQAGFLVLRNTTMPSVLIETGYLSNTSDEAYLLTKQGKSQVANAIFHAFSDYKYEMESNPAKPQLAAQTTTRQYTRKSVPQLQKQVVTTPKTPVNHYTSPATYHATASIQDNSFTPALTTYPNSASQPKTGNQIRPSRIIPITKPNATSPKAQNSQFTSTYQSASPQADNQPITFMVQLASADRLLDTQQGKWSRVPRSINVKKEDGLYKYLVMGFKDLRTAVDGQSQLRSLGFKDAFVVAYQNGVRISLSQAKALARIN